MRRPGIKIIVPVALTFVTFLLIFLHYSDSNDRYLVTKIIHQSWKNKLIPERFQNYSKSWTQGCFKDWTYMFWTDENNYNLIRLYYPWFLKIYNNLPKSIYRADVMRYFYMFHYGGIYTDLDNECLKPFEHLLYNYFLVFGAMDGQYGSTNFEEGYVQNSFMYSRPKHEFWLEVIHEIIKISQNPTKPGVPEAFTGPIVMSEILKRYIERKELKNETQLLKIYPANYFNPFSWLKKRKSSSSCKDFNRMSYIDWQTCKASMIARGSYVVQYHAHTW